MGQKGKTRKYKDGAVAYEKYLEKQREYTRKYYQKNQEEICRKAREKYREKKAQLAEIEELKKKIAELEGKQLWIKNRK